MISLETIRAKIREALALHYTPHQTALAFSLGVFIAFSPTYGLHFASVVFVAWMFRLNFPALLVGSLTNNPWTVVPIVAATMWTGVCLVGMPNVPDFAWEHFSLHGLYEWVMPLLLPFTLGALTLGVFSALLAYPVGLLLATRYAKQHPAPISKST